MPQNWSWHPLKGYRSLQSSSIITEKLQCQRSNFLSLQPKQSRPFPLLLPHGNNVAMVAILHKISQYGLYFSISKHSWFFPSCKNRKMPLQESFFSCFNFTFSHFQCHAGLFDHLREKASRLWWLSRAVKNQYCTNVSMLCSNFFSSYNSDRFHCKTTKLFLLYLTVTRACLIIMKSIKTIVHCGIQVLVVYQYSYKSLNTIH